MCVENPYKSPAPPASADVISKLNAEVGDAGTEYDYRPKWTAVLLCAVFFGALAIFFAATANNNDRGLIINGIIELSPSGAKIFYWVFAGLCVALVAGAGVLAIDRLTVRRRITLSESGLIIPRSRWSAEEIAVPFSEVVRLSTSEFQRQRFLKIVYTGGKFTLNASMLPSKDDFDEILVAINQGIRNCQR